MGIGPAGSHSQKFRAIVHTGHLHIGHFRVLAAQRFDDVLHIQQGFMIFGGKADRHHRDRRGPQINQVLGGQRRIRLRPFN